MDFKIIQDDVLTNNFDSNTYPLDRWRKIISDAFSNLDHNEQVFETISQILLGFFVTGSKSYYPLMCHIFDNSINGLTLDQKKELIQIFSKDHCMKTILGIIFNLVDFKYDKFTLWLIEEFIDNHFNKKIEMMCMSKSVLCDIMYSNFEKDMPRKLLKKLVTKYPLSSLSRGSFGKSVENNSILEKLVYLDAKTSTIFYHIFLDVYSHDIPGIEIESLLDDYKPVRMYKLMLQNNCPRLHARVLVMMNEIKPNLTIELPEPYYHYGQLFYSFGRLDAKTLYEKYKIHKIYDYKYVNNDRLFELGDAHRDKNPLGFLNNVTKGYCLKDKIVYDVFKNYIIPFIK